VLVGCKTFNTAAIATAASAALPPPFMIERPISEAVGEEDAAIACVLITGERRPLNGKSLPVELNEKRVLSVIDVAAVKVNDFSTFIITFRKLQG
jgi:hypothetical protein